MNDEKDPTEEELDAGVREGDFWRAIGDDGKPRYWLTEQGQAKAKHLLETSEEAREWWRKLKAKWPN